MNSALVNAANDIVIANSAIQIPLSEPFPDFELRGRAIGGCTIDDIGSFCRKFNSAEVPLAATTPTHFRYSFKICSGDVCITKSPFDPFNPY